MATLKHELLSVDEYLHTSFDDGDHEYVDGRIEERNLGELDHALPQKRLVALLEAKGLFAIQEVRLRVSATRYRVPDVQAYYEKPEEQVFTKAPLLVAEVLSPEDRIGRMYEKFDDYAALGVKHLYLLDPDRKSIREFEEGEFLGADSLRWEGGALLHSEIWEP